MSVARRMRMAVDPTTARGGRGKHGAALTLVEGVLDVSASPLLHSLTCAAIGMQETEDDRNSNSEESRWGFLAPWTALLKGQEVCIKTKCVGDDTYRFTFESICLNMQHNVILDRASHHTLQSMAEAVQLVATALALYPDSWTCLLVDHCECDFYFDPSIHDTSELVPRFEFDCSYYPGDILMAKTGLRFFQVLLDASARTPLFHRAMEQLLELPTADMRPHRGLAPVACRIDLSLWNEDRDILAGFMEFVQALKPFSVANPVDGSRQWCFVEAINIDWTGPGVCSDLVKRTLVLVADAPFVQITTVTIDPANITCSSVELRLLLNTLTAIYPKLKLRLGNVAPRGAGSASRLGSNATREANVQMVIDSVGWTRAHIKYLNIGHLMNTGHDERERRQAVWSYLFGSLLSPYSECRIETLSLNSPWVLNAASDARDIRQAIASSPNLNLPARLILGLTGMDPPSVHAIIYALGANLLELCLYDRRQVIPSETVAYILQNCPKLECLDLDNAAIDTMDLFFASHIHCQLTRLILNNVTLRDASSMPKFLIQLADPQSRVGSSLREFVLARYGYPAARHSSLALNMAHIDLVKRALRFNGRVHTLQLGVDEAVPRESIAACLAHHGTAAAVRLAPLALPSKLAFLSVLEAHQQSPWTDLSTDVVGNVFQFAAECKPRWVHVKHM